VHPSRARQPGAKLSLFNQSSEAITSIRDTSQEVGGAERRSLWRRFAFQPLDLQFTASVELGRAQAIVRFGGQLDLSSCALCERHLEEIAAVADGALVLDLSRLEFIDSAGASTLVGSAQRLSATRSVTFLIPPGPIRHVFDLLRLGDVIPIECEIPTRSTGLPSRTASMRSPIVVAAN
jgi:anti-sigma B factor antagonist